MTRTGFARYKPDNNTLEVVRPGEQNTRIIRCSNLNPGAVRVFGVDVHGDEVRVYVGGHTNQRPSHMRVYSMMSLTGGHLVPL